MMKAIATSGGVCSIKTVGAFVNLSCHEVITTDTVFRHMEYMAELIGIDHAGFSSDWMPYSVLIATQGVAASDEPRN